MEIDIIKGAKVLILKHYKAFVIYLSIYMLAFEDNCFCLEVTAFFTKKWSLFKMFIQSALYLTKKPITGKQKQLSSKANVFVYAYAACKVWIWYVVPFFKQTKTRNYQKKKKKRNRQKDKELSKKKKISLKTWWRHRDVIKCAWMER